jgi:site-specific DNA-methyltransferase (adenine-specific)
MINLMQGDCLERMKEIPDGSVDMILTDPPYGTTSCKWDSIIPLEPMWEQLKRIIKPNGAIVLFGSEPFSSALRISNLNEFKYDWTWKKTRPTMYHTAKHRPLSIMECISVFSKGSVAFNAKNIMPYNPQKTKGHKKVAPKNQNNVISDFKPGRTPRKDTSAIDYKGTERYPNNIIEFKNNERCLHPTQKPIELMEYLIKTYTNEGETVLDFTMGSGSTGFAAKNLNRDFIGIELDETYFNIAKERIENA